MFLPAIDRASFAVALAARLRSRGIGVDPTAIADLVAGLDIAFPQSHDELYWLARITLVSRYDDLETFDRVFAAVFDDAVLPMDPAARRQGSSGLPPSKRRTGVRRSEDGDGDGEQTPLPWSTLPEARPREPDGDARDVPLLRASAAEAIAQLPFEALSEAQLRLLSEWLQRCAPLWPTRRHRRHRVDPHGRRVALRRTLARARHTGLEPIELVRESPTPRPRPVVMVGDVSQSMRVAVGGCLHLMRALVRQRDAEVFATGTELTRLTAVLRDSLPERALSAATETVRDRFGGTRLAHGLQTLLDSRHGGLLRGAIVVIASDGWDSDPPAEMARSMQRVARRAHRVVWLNPRAGSPGFEPSTSAMAAALPYCDLLLPADSFAALRDAVDRIASIS